MLSVRPLMKGEILECYLPKWSIFANPLIGEKENYDDLHARSGREGKKGWKDDQGFALEACGAEWNETRFRWDVAHNLQSRS